VESELKLADEANPPLVAVKLTDCIVRGDLTLLASDQAGLIEVLWDNGLLVAGKGMIETGGAANRAGAMAARVRLIMNDVTAVLEGPLVAQRLVSGANQPIPIDREANRCVFSFPANSAMLEVSGLPELAALERIVSMRGRDNYYDSSRGKTQFYVIGSSLDRANLRFSVADLMSGSLPKWAGESSPQAVVYWTKIPPSPLNSHLRTPGDFLQEGVVLPGFVGERLPFVQLLEGGGLGEGI
jgi:serine/threonine-protein kinase